jgi:serine/threonine protein kinase
MGRRGTGGYRAPELFAQHPTYTTQSDIWGLGCILYELLTFERAFAEDWNIREYASSMKPLSFPTLPFDVHTNTLLASMTRSMLSLNPADRPSAADIGKLGRIDVKFPNFWGPKYSPGFGVRRFMLHPRENSGGEVVPIDKLARLGSFRNHGFSFSMEVESSS